METIYVEYLEYGKLFINGGASEFYDLAFTTGTNRYSNLVRKEIAIDDRSQFSAIPGNISFAFLPVLNRSRYALVQFQSRFENEFGGAHSNRPFSQIKFLLFDAAKWFSLYEKGLSVFPSFLPHKYDATGRLKKFSSVVGDVGKSLPIQILEPNGSNNLFFHLDREGRKFLQKVSVIADAVLKYRDLGGIAINYNVSLYEKLMLMDAVMRVVLPIVREPFSFVLDSACATNAVLKFYGQSQNQKEGHVLDFSGDNWQQAKSSMDERIRLFAGDTENWYQQQKRIYKNSNM